MELISMFQFQLGIYFTSTNLIKHAKAIRINSEADLYPLHRFWHWVMTYVPKFGIWWLKSINRHGRISSGNHIRMDGQVDKWKDIHTDGQTGRFLYAGIPPKLCGGGGIIMILLGVFYFYTLVYYRTKNIIQNTQNFI